MATGALIEHLGRGLASERPAAPDLFTGVLGIYFATDAQVLSVWDGVQWTDLVFGPSIEVLPPSGGFDNGALLQFLDGVWQQIDPGTPGQVLRLMSGEIAFWDDDAGAVASVNGQTGDVLLSLEDLIDVLPGTGAPAAGEVLTFDGSDWTAQAPQGDGLDADASGFRGVPQNAQTGNYTTVASDAGQHIYHAAAAGAGDTYTIAANASVPYDIGTAITFVNMSTDSIAIAINSDTLYFAGSGTTGSRTLAQYGEATALKIGSTEWLISGVGLS